MELLQGAHHIWFAQAKTYSLTHPYFSMRETIHQQRLRRLKWWRREWGAQTTQTWQCRFLFSNLIFVTASPKHIALWLMSHSLHSWFHVLLMLRSFSQKLLFLPLATLRGCVSPLVFVSYASCVRLCTYRSLSISAVSLWNCLHFTLHSCSCFHCLWSYKLTDSVFLCYFKVTNNFSYWKIKSWSHGLSTVNLASSHIQLPLSLFSGLTTPWLLLSLCLECLSLKRHRVSTQ